MGPPIGDSKASVKTWILAAVMMPKKPFGFIKKYGLNAVSAINRGGWYIS
jgi:hypothetical protein